MEDSLWEDIPQSLFRPSYAATWLNCLGALQPSRYAQDTAGVDAAIGTVFHWLMAEWQTNGRPDHWLGHAFTVEKEDKSESFEILCDDDMFLYAEECLERYGDLDGDVFIETRVDISDLTPIQGQGGTADRAHCSPGLLEIIDWKYGRGVKVFAKNCEQELLYGWGFFKEYDSLYDFKRIRLHIAQPRLNHFDVWEITREELIEWAAWAKERAHAAWKPRADRSPSPKACQWCKVRVNCPALKATRQALVDMTFDVLDEPVTEKRMQEIVEQPAELVAIVKPITIPTEQLATILLYRKLMESWFEDIATELTARAQNGEQIKGWKVVEGRSFRQWRDENTVIEKLGLLGLDDEIWKHSMVSPPQAEKLLKKIGVGAELAKNFVKTLVYKPPGKPTLAPDRDNRLALPNLADDTFEGDDL